jgi:prepilin-type N-terminal cleavage/methylation domain-containing protein
VKNDPAARSARSQGGFTLVELLIASAISVIVLAGLSSLFYTSWQANTTATSRVEASSQVRSFELFAYDDFALSTVPPVPVGCVGSTASPCTTQPIILQGPQASNSTNPSVAAYTVSYTWDGSGLLERQVGGNPPVHAATNVSAFSWYIDGSSVHQTVVVTIAITVQAYTQVQTLRFYPRVNNP